MKKQDGNLVKIDLKPRSNSVARVKGTKYIIRDQKQLSEGKKRVNSTMRRRFIPGFDQINFEQTCKDIRNK